MSTRSISRRTAFAALFAATAIAPLCTAAAENEAVSDNMVRYAVESDFDTVKDALSQAITNQGLVINSESHIDGMLERTGQDLGNEGKIYEHAVAFEFCSAKFSRQMMAADPHNIVFCPFVISVYAIPAEPETVYVAYRRPWRSDGSEASAEALQAVEGLLDTIASEAADW